MAKPRAQNNNDEGINDAKGNTEQVNKISLNTENQQDYSTISPQSISIYIYHQERFIEGNLH